MSVPPHPPQGSLLTLHNMSLCLCQLEPFILSLRFSSIHLHSHLLSRPITVLRKQGGFKKQITEYCCLSLQHEELEKTLNFQEGLMVEDPSFKYEETGWNRSTRMHVDTDRKKGIYCKEFVHGIMEADKSQDVRLANWGPRGAGCCSPRPSSKA